MDTYGHMKTLKDIRDGRCMSQLEFSQWLGMDQSHYGKLERGMVQPRMSTIKLIAQRLKLARDVVKEMIAQGMETYQASEHTNEKIGGL